MRFERFLTSVDLSKRILEIGPLDRPLISKAEGDVYYADIIPTEEIIKEYSSNERVVPENMCPIDFVIKESYTKAVGDSPKFDYIISSHVIEHMPRFIEHFQDTANILNDGGQMVLIIPDHRYCFDHFRSPTTFAELYYIHTQGINVAPWQLLDSLLMTVPLNEPAAFTTHKNMYHLLAQRPSFKETLEAYEAALVSKPAATHCSVFTPRSFLMILYDMLRAGLLPYRLITVHPTLPYDHSFCVVLQLAKNLTSREDAMLAELKKIQRALLLTTDAEEECQKLVDSQKNSK